MSSSDLLKLPRIPARGYLVFGEVTEWLDLTTRQLHYWLNRHTFICDESRDDRVWRFYKADLQALRCVHSTVIAERKTHSQVSFESLNDRGKAKLAAPRPKHKPRHRRTMPLNRDLGLSEATVADLAGVHVETARRYLKAGEALYAVSELIELKLSGRVLPKSWTHCFINHRDNLEINGVGEVCENEILQIDWARRLYYSHIKTLERDLSITRGRVAYLESQLDAENSEELSPQASGDQLQLGAKS